MQLCGPLTLGTSTRNRGVHSKCKSGIFQRLGPGNKGVVADLVLQSQCLPFGSPPRRLHSFPVETPEHRGKWSSSGRDP